MGKRGFPGRGEDKTERRKREKGTKSISAVNPRHNK